MFKLLPALGAVGGLMIAASDVRAGYTQVKKKGEISQEQVLERLYGGDFVRSGEDLSNGAVTATRVDDAADQTISSPRQLELVGAFARNRWGFGVESADGSRREVSAPYTGSGFDVSGDTVSWSSTDEAQLVIARGPNKVRASGDAEDAMITYRLDGVEPGKDVHLHFWEDKRASARSDMDFNDLVIRSIGEEAAAEPVAASDVAVGAGNAQAAAVPLPAAVWPGLAGLAGVALLTAKRARARRA
jgi:hypothetical protein